jgi:hypothetical protein
MFVLCTYKRKLFLLAVLRISYILYRRVFKKYHTDIKYEFKIADIQYSKTLQYLILIHILYVAHHVQDPARIALFNIAAKYIPKYSH